MEDQRGPSRRHPSPSAQRRIEEHWKARIGLVLLALVILGSGVVILGLLRAARVS
jgi:hypothetical protein